MADEKQLKRLKRSVKEWNAWRERYPHIRPDLGGADLSDADLSGANLRGTYLSDADLSGAFPIDANLSNANLSNADLRGADLSEANLSNADLIWANLSVANLRDANLSNANLSRAYLTHANLWMADLSGANLSDADLTMADLSRTNLSGAGLNGAIAGNTSFGNFDLSTVKGLDSVKHLAPSSIGIDTIYNSKGKIPEIFLRGCGVPDVFIEYMPSLTMQDGKPIQFYSCFISYSNKDKRFCKRLYNDLQDAGVRTWYFPEDAMMGKTVWGEIDRSIKLYDKLVVVCSKNSLNSGPVLREIDRGLNREDREKKNVLFPITIDNYIFNEWEHERKDDVLAKVVGDFRGWSGDSKKYEKEFKRMLKALQAED